MASETADHAAVHARAIRLAARLADLGRRLSMPTQVEYNAEAAELIHRLRDDPGLLVKVVMCNRTLLEPAVSFILRSNSVADDLQVTILFVCRLLQQCPGIEFDLYRCLWVRFGGTEFLAATCGSLIHSLLGPLEIDLDLDLQAVLRAINENSLIPTLVSSSNAPNAPKCFSFTRPATDDGTGHLQERTRMIRRRLQSRIELCTGIVLELIRAIYRGLDAFPPGFIIALRTLREEIDARQDPDLRLRIRQVFLDTVLGFVFEKPDCFDFIPQYFLNNTTRSSLKQLKQIISCLGAGSMITGSSAQVINAFVDEYGLLVDQLIADLLRAEQLSVSSPLCDTTVQHCALSKSHLNAFMAVMARFSDVPDHDGSMQSRFYDSNDLSSSKELLLSCFDQFDTNLKPMLLRPVESGLDLAIPRGGLLKVLFECLSRLPVCGIVESGSSFLHYLQQTVAFARLKAERHHSSDLCSVISHLSGFIWYAHTMQAEVDWAQELSTYMDSTLSQHESHISDHLKMQDSCQLSLAIINNIIQSTNITRDSLRAQQSVQNFVRNARFDFKVLIKNSKSTTQFRAFKKSISRKSSDTIEIHCRSMDQMVHDLRELFERASSDVFPSVIDSILKKLVVSVEQDLAGVADAMRYISAFFMERLYPHLFSSSTTSDVENQAVQDQLVRFSDITLDQLDMPSSSILQSVLLLPIAEIGKINLFVNPSKKVECIVRATRQAMDALRLHATDTAAVVPGSDQLLPVMVFIILKARPAELNRNCCFCRLYWNAEEVFMDRHELQSLYRFCFVQFLSAVKFISQLSPNLLSTPVSRTPTDGFTATRNALAA